MWLFPLAYFGFFLWLVVAYGDKMLPLAASEHGAETDWLMNFNWWILLIAFVITNILLFYFAGKYVYRQGPPRVLAAAQQQAGADLDGDPCRCTGRDHHLRSQYLEQHHRTSFA